MKTLVIRTAAALALLASGNALAQTSPITQFLDVTATVTEACASLTVTPVDFGSASAADVDDDATSTITVTCNTGANYDVEIDYGANAIGTQRQVTSTAAPSAGEFMDYDIFQPGGFTTQWGAKADNKHYVGTGSGAAQALTANFRLHRSSGTSPGTFTDQVEVKLNF